MEEKLRFHVRYQKCSLVSIEVLDVMTVNIKEGKYGGGGGGEKDVSMEIQSALA